jgi:hypothetical protein
MTEDFAALLAAERRRNDRLEQAVAELSGRRFDPDSPLSERDSLRHPASSEIAAEQRRAAVRVIGEYEYTGDNVREIQTALCGMFTVNEDKVRLGHRGGMGPPWPLCVVRDGFCVTVRPGDTFQIDDRGRIHIGEIEGSLEWARARQRVSHDAVGPAAQIFDRNQDQAASKAELYKQFATQGTGS